METIQIESVDAEICVPEMVICQNDDQFEVAQDPFADEQTEIFINNEELDDYDEGETAATIRIINVRSKDEPPSDEDETTHFDDVPIDHDADFTDTEEELEPDVGAKPVKGQKLDMIREDKSIESMSEDEEISIDENVKSSKKSGKPNKSTERKPTYEKRGRPKNTEEHKCTICDKVYSYASLLARHTRTHSIDKGFNCTHCSKSFARADHCRTHMDNVHKGEVVDGQLRQPTTEQTCEICKKIFHHMGNYRKHLKIHSGERPFKCEHCDKTFMLSQHLKSHIQLIHLNEKAFQCALCGKLFNHISNYKKHMRIHNGIKPFKCKICDKHFGSSSNFQTHMRVHANDRPFKCTECDRAFVQAIHLTMHIRVHTGEKPYPCPTCDRRFRLKAACESHQRTHTGQTPFKCEHCSREFRHMNHLKTHEKTHSSDRQFKCTECDKAFMFNHQLITHSRLHTGEKPFVCDVCGAAFTMALHRQRHMKFTHQITRAKSDVSFTCDECGRVFRDRRLFANHLKIHSGERPYKCEYCDKSFITQSDCKKHQRIHTGEKPYTCDLCQKSFTFSNSYRIHMRNHFGEKPFKCPVCDKAFSCSSDRGKHVKTHM